MLDFGGVKLSVKVASDGTPQPISVSGGHGLLQEAAKENVVKWKLNEGPEREIEITYIFKLEGKPYQCEVNYRVVFDLPSQVLIVTNPVPVDHASTHAPKK